MIPIPNAPAFPSEQTETQDGTWNQTFERGLTMREYFAAMAMQGLVRYDPYEDLGAAAVLAVKAADALIEELSK